MLKILIQIENIFFAFLYFLFLYHRHNNFQRYYIAYVKYMNSGQSLVMKYTKKSIRHANRIL